MNKYLILFLLFVFFAIVGKSQTISKVGCDLPHHTTALGLYNNKLLHSGLDTNCGVGIYNVGVWNDTTWSGIYYADPRNGSAPIQSFCEYNNDLYVGSGLYYMGNKRINKIARWDGTNWYSLGLGLNALFSGEHINSLIEYNGELYVAGRIIEINGLKNVHNIARWDGTTWKRVGTGLQGSLNEVYSMAVYKNELYVGGGFSDAGGITAYNIAKWNGTTWSTVGLGTNEAVMKLYVDTIRNLLYVGGGFSAVNNNTLASCIASWDGTNWSAMGNKTFTIDVSSMEMYHGYLYAGGLKFTDTCFARWDGLNWEVIDGPNGNVTSLQTYKDKLYLGGDFTMIGTDSIQYLASYYSPDSVFIGVEQHRLNSKIKLYPNPTKNVLNIVSETDFEHFSIYTIFGQELISNKLKENKIEISTLPSGVYILKLKNKDHLIQEWFLKE